MEHYDPKGIDRYLDALRPDNLLLEVSGPNVETDAVEPWFQVPYAQTPLKLDLGSPSPAELGLVLPPPNEFVPTNLALIDQSPSRPTRIDSTVGLSFWWAPDASFGTPRATTYVRLDVPGGLDSPTDAAYARLYARLVVDALNTFAYPAQIAGLGYDVGVQPNGFLVTVTGYDDKQPLLLHHILDVFGSVEPTAPKVSGYRDELLRSWENFTAQPPYQQALASLSNVMIAGDWPPARLSEALHDVTPASLAAWRHDRLDHYGALVLMHGNVDARKAAAVSRMIETTLKLAPVDVAPDTVARLPAGDFTFALNARSDDAAMLLYLQGADPSFEERARFGLTSQVLRTPYYDDLRTQQQLGYVVAVTPSVLRRTPGLAFVVQSPVSGPGALLEATKTFLDGYRGKLARTSADELSAYEQGLIGLLLEKDKNLADRSQRYWRDLDVGITSFDSREQIAARIDRIDLPALMKFYDRLLELVQTRRLVIYSAGRFHDRPPGTAVADVGAFRSAAGVVTPDAAPRASATP
jgi:secreted Zn-dependent insulinase-like peptidase